MSARRVVRSSETIDDPNPGTPDHEVSRMRLRGRRDARAYAHADYRGNVTISSLGIEKRDACEWWLGWTDERYKRFFGRA